MRGRGKTALTALTAVALACGLCGCTSGGDTSSQGQASQPVTQVASQAGAETGREPNQPSDFEVSVVEGGVEIVNYVGQPEEIVIPRSINGYLVVGIAEDAFRNRSAITYVQLPDSLEYVGAHAFDGCKSLAEVVLPESLASIGAGAFAGTALSEATIPGALVERIRPGAFPDGCLLETAGGEPVEVQRTVIDTGTVDEVTGLAVVEFGSYPQSGADAAEPIEWLVLGERADGTTLLLSRYALDARPYNDEYTDVTWETCSLREWLNGEFLQSAFTPDEAAAIVETHLANADNPRYGTEGGEDTDDMVFLLSLDEVDQYLGVDGETWDEMLSEHEDEVYSSGSHGRDVNYSAVYSLVPEFATLVAQPTPHAVEDGAYAWDSASSDSPYANGACYWWLRSPAGDADCAARVDPDGHVGAFGYYVVDYVACAVRPALVVNL